MVDLIVPGSIDCKPPARGSILFLLLFAASHIAFALDPDRTIAQFYHTAWTIEDGVPSGAHELAQTKDGYLWLAAESGLFRFDGVRCQRYQPERGDPIPSQDIAALLATPDGGLWIGFRPYGATFLRNGRGHSYGEREGLPLSTITQFALDREGAIWASTTRGLFRFTNSRWEKIGTEWGFFSERARSLFLDSQGKLWVNGFTDLYCLSPGAHVFQRRKVPHNWAMKQAPDGTLWMWEGFDRGMRAVYGPLAEFYDGSKAAMGPRLFLDLVDREGGFWMQTQPPGEGLRRVANPERLPNALIDETSRLIQTFTHKDGLTSDQINSALEDTEGNVWVATMGGLDRFRKKNVVQGPFPTPTTGYNPLLVTDRKGIIWEGSGRSLMTVASDGVSVREGLQFGPARLLGFLPEMTFGWCDFEGALWLGGRGTLTRWIGGRLENVEFPDKNLVAGHWDVQSITGNRTGDLLVSVQQHGVYRRHDGVWAPYGLPGLPKSTPMILWTDSMDRVWIGYLGNQIGLLDGDRVRTFSAPEGLHVGNVLAIGGRGNHIWAAGQFGLALFDGSKFQTLAGEADSDFRGISGVVETADGEFWLNMATGVARIPAAEIANRLRDPQHKLQYDLFDFRDGVKGTAAQIRPLPSAVEAGDGRIWMSGSNGVYWVDPARIYKNPTPPPITIEAIYADDRRFSAFEASQLPKLPQNVRIEYTALSLSIPERVRFRYQLEGFDKGWQDVGTRRAAYYPKLPPGHFRFHVIACNNDGVWNETGASIGLSIAPAFYQAIWFQALCWASGAGILWLFYLLRLKQATAQAQGRLEERLAERERIARELHDTLLQGFQGLTLHFQAAMKQIPDREPARHTMERALKYADEVLLEGRERVRDLRAEGATANELSEMVAGYGKGLRNNREVEFKVTVVGSPLLLHPVVRDEVYRITREALANAFEHSKASSIETEITYARASLSARVRDNGCGIDSEILSSGRQGHWGLPGMRERARKIGGHLKLWSNPGAGTEIDLSVPAKVAYVRSGSESRWKWIRRVSGHAR